MTSYTRKPGEWDDIDVLTFHELANRFHTNTLEFDQWKIEEVLSLKGIPREIEFKAGNGITRSHRLNDSHCLVRSRSTGRVRVKFLVDVENGYSRLEV